MPIRRRKQTSISPRFTAEERTISDSDRSVLRGLKKQFVTGVYLSPDHTHLAVVTEHNNISLYRLEGEQLAEKLAERRVDDRTRVVWSTHGSILAFVNEDHQAEVILVPSGKSKLLGSAFAVSFYPDGSRLAILDRTSLTIWTIEPLAVTRKVKVPAGARGNTPFVGPTFTLNVSPDGRWLARGTETSTIQILESDTFKVVYEFLAHTNLICDLEWLGPDTLATASADETIRIWKVPEGQELRVLEAESPVFGISYSVALKCLIGWTNSEYFVWSVSTGEIQLKEPLPASGDLGYRYVSASPCSDLFVRLNGPGAEEIAFSHGWDTTRGRSPRSVITYANAKVLLLGDSGVGKSGLAVVLAGEPFRPTESTHARRIWKMPVPELNQGMEAQREVLLWDLAGQPGYRIVHQLHLGDGAAALILFDSRSETTPLAGVGYWARALRHAQVGTRDVLPVFLVAARTDRGMVSVSDERVAEVVAKFGIHGFQATSAKEGWGVGELRRTILSAIDWTHMPLVTSSALFAAAKSFVLNQKEAGTLLTPLASLLAAFLGTPVTGPSAHAIPDAKVGRDLLEYESASGQLDHTGLRGVFEGCVARLESAGLVKRLAFGDMVLLQPELIDVYAGAIVNAARDEPDGLGSMLESRVLDVDFRLPEQERIADRQQERLLIIATLEELIRHEIVLREETEAGVQLVFPAAFRRDLPEAAEPTENTTEFTFEGPVDNIYATLVVRLARSERFTRRGAFQSAAQFEADSGGICTMHLTRSDEGRGTLKVGYSEKVADVVRFQFERFITTHLERRSMPGTVRRISLYRCPDCGTPFSAAQIEAALSRRRASLLCPVDETRVPLDDSYTEFSHGQDKVTGKMNASADEARSIAAASSIILGKEETTDFDVFLCHHIADKPAVRSIAQRLRKQGILPWLDEAELIPGRPWQEELERQISHIRAAAVFVGPGGIGPWQNQEMRAFLNEFVERGCPVIPVLLPGAVIPDLPVFLRRMTWVDLRRQDANRNDATGIQLLIWGITGHKLSRSRLGQALE
jgi:WD40 repeat protein